MASCAVYSSIMKYLSPSFFKYRPLKKEEYKSIFLVSVIFIVNIVLSNSSLKYNSLALDQVLLDFQADFVDVSLCYACFYMCIGVFDLWYC